MHPLRWFLFLIAFGVCLPVSAQNDWAGKKVILKRPGLKVGYSDENGKQVYVAELTNLSYAVIAENQGFLRVRHGSETGWFTKADALLPEEAIPYFAERARTAKDNDGYPLAYLGWAYKELQKYDLAIAAYDAAIKRDPRPAWFNNRGLIYRETKKHEPALADFNEAIKRSPNFATAFENRAATYEDLGKVILALDDWNRALAIEPANGPFLRRRALLYASQKEFGKAIADLTTMLKDDPKNAAVIELRGQYQIDAGNIDAAIADYSEVLRLDKKNADVYLGRSQLYTDKKRYAEAIADAESALKAVPTFVAAKNALGWNRFLTGEFEKASADFEKALEMNPKFAPTLYYQAWLWATCPDEKYRDGKKALDAAKKAIELSSGKTEPAFLKAQAAAHAELGEFDEAIELQQRAFVLDPAKEVRARLDGYRKKEAYRQAIAK